MQRMRLISEAYEYIKKQDPDTCITKTGFRRLINEGRIPVLQIGNKKVVNLDHVDSFFADGEHSVRELAEIEAKGKIRKVVV